MIRSAKNAILITTLLFMQVSITMYAAAAILNFKYSDRVLPGVCVAGFQVGGLTVEEAVKLINSQLPGAATLELPDGSAGIIPLGTAGLTFDVETSANRAFAMGRPALNPLDTAKNLAYFLIKHELPLEVQVDEPALLEYILSILQPFDREPVNARLEHNNHLPEIIPDLPGLSTDGPMTMALLLEHLRSGHFEPTAAITIANKPHLTTSDLRPFTHLHADFSTILDNDPNRTHNIYMAANSVDHLIIEPNEMFSFNHNLGPRLEETGYRKATVIVNNQMTLDYGGGICQLASTIYNAVLLSDLEVLERRPHTLPVSYVPKGRDAAVSWDSLDLKFINNKDHPLLLTANIYENRLSVKLFGTKHPEHPEISLGTNIDSTPPRVTIIKNHSLPSDTKFSRNDGRKGYRIVSHREIIGIDELEERYLISSEYYAPEKTVLVVGTAKNKARYIQRAGK